jgi:hypothetical protein
LEHHELTEHVVGVDRTALADALDRFAGPLDGGDLRVLSQSKLRGLGFFGAGPLERRALAQEDGGPADEAAPEQSEGSEQFLRFSAFVDDLRIRADGSVVPGTYATTRDDGIRVKSGSEAVARYALPNPDPAVHRFHLGPPHPVEIRRGTVQPAYGHTGGGAEVIFDVGAPARTCLHRDQIPP